MICVAAIIFLISSLTGNDRSLALHGSSLGALLGSIRNAFENRPAASASRELEGAFLAKFCPVERAVGLGNTF